MPASSEAVSDAGNGLLREADATQQLLEARIGPKEVESRVILQVQVDEPDGPIFGRLFEPLQGCFFDSKTGINHSKGVG